MSLEQVRTRLARAAILLDFDGTLAPIVARPEEARPVQGATEAIADLLTRCLSVTIVTGRPEAFIRQHLDVAGLGVAGLYGSEGSAESLGADVVEEIAEVSRGVAGSQVEEKGASVAVHFRNAPEPDAAAGRLEPSLAALADRHGLELRQGKRVLELLPAGSKTKGDVVRDLVGQAEAALYAGDDLADIEAFDTLDGAAGSGLAACLVAVRGAETPAALLARADEVVDGPAGLIHLLETL